MSLVFIVVVKFENKKLKKRPNYATLKREIMFAFVSAAAIAAQTAKTQQNDERGKNVP